MRHWSVLVPGERYATERMYANDMLLLTFPPSRLAADLRPGDRVALVADVDEPVVFALAAVAGVDQVTDPAADGDPADNELARDRSPGPVRVRLAYTDRLFDDERAVPAGRPEPDAPRALTEAQFGALRPPAASVASWLVSVDLPIEAASPGEAVRRFWSYVRELGPTELPAFVSPAGDELAMQAYVLGAEANLDPEEDE